MIFKSDWRDLCCLPQFTQEEIKHEPMFFGADLEFAYAKGGLITRCFLDALALVHPDKEWIIDSRVHMLKSGWMPCIPGWHVDDFYRPDDFGGQSDLWSQPRDHRIHVMAVNGIDAFPEFLAPYTAFEFRKEDIGEGESVHGAGNRIINAKPHHRRAVESGRMIEFDTHDWHRGVAATRDSWRHFIRASCFAEGLNKKTSRPITNEIRNQVQVYLPAYEAGW